MIYPTLFQTLCGEFITFVLATTVITVLFIDFWKKHWFRQLPGPPNAPLLGYVPFLFSKKPHELLFKLRGKYGSIYGFYLGERYVIALNDIKSIRETLNREEFLARPSIHPMNMFENNSLLISNGPVWKQEKRVAQRIFHELGFGGKVMEQRVKDEISHFMRRIAKYEGTPFDMRQYLQESVNNNISSLLFGQRFDYDDPITIALINNVNAFEHSNPSVDITNFFPYLKPVMRGIGINPTSECLCYADAVADIIRKKLNNEKGKLEEGAIRSYLHGYLLQMEKDKGETTLTEDAVIGTAKVYYMAGLSTAVNTIEWLLLGLILNPHVQEHIQQEIDEVISRNGSIHWSDQKTMHYTRAVILETMRWRTLLPISVPRCAFTETTIQSYTVPRNAIVFTNIWAAHNDPSIWKNPEEFNPERFLDEEGKIINSDYCIPFSFGRRSCPGENLAQLQVFLYCVNILGRYHVSSGKEDVLSLDGISLFTNVPKSFRTLLTSRI